MLSSVTGVDYLGREPRFEVVYHLRSLADPHLVVLKVGAAEENPHRADRWYRCGLPRHTRSAKYSTCSASLFDGHPDLQRILMPDDWDGHPQRKDEPLVYEEVAFTLQPGRDRRSETVRARITMSKPT